MSDKPEENQLEWNELLRITILLEAYNLQFKEFTLKSVAIKLRNFRGRPTSDAQIFASVRYLTGKSYLSMRYGELGATQRYCITANGLDIMEREFAHLLDSD